MDKLTQWSTATNVTSAQTSRRTIDGRRLTYKLHVLQQPERARACGNGAKASADRRPVDPPPVVELRVFEGENENEMKDITISYHNVNFFLFATLEARPIANGRVHAPGPPTVAVLNGCNVAGINYLERPSPAGYFIFPDLSVRHEGYYRLTFGLYEQVKDPRDADPERPFPTPGSVKPSDKPGPPQMHNASVQRLEVRSEEFQVYSAKKFPGLDRSTGLSIGLSDQGCRVRIRRDVRMRKRPKPKAVNEQPYGEDHLRGRYATPEGMPMPPNDRPRSLSHGSRDGSQYGERRLSVHTDVYSHSTQPPALMNPGAPLSGSGFAVPTTPSSALPPSSSYHQHHYPPSTALPSPVPAPPPSRIQDYATKPSPYRPYEHRPSDASSGYAPSDPGSRRLSESTTYGRPSESNNYRPSEPSPYRSPENNNYRPSESSYPAHYSYSSANKVVIAPEQPLLPSVSDLIRETDLRHGEIQAGKRSFSPPRYNTQPLKSGMRPSLTHDSYGMAYLTGAGVKGAQPTGNAKRISFETRRQSPRTRNRNDHEKRNGTEQSI